MKKTLLPLSLGLAATVFWAGSAFAQIPVDVPEPAALGLLATGVVGLAAYRHWRGRK